MQQRPFQGCDIARIPILSPGAGLLTARWQGQPQNCSHRVIKLVSMHVARASAAKAMGDAMTTASHPSRGGFVREALTSQYPRLAGVLEQALQRIHTDTQVRMEICIPPA